MTCCRIWDGVAKGSRIDTKHSAALTEILPDLALEDVRGKERRALRIGIPEGLEVAINGIAEQTGQPFLTVLLEARGSIAAFSR